jgi:hypothetical protein
MELSFDSLDTPALTKELINEKKTSFDFCLSYIPRFVYASCSIFQ